MWWSFVNIGLKLWPVRDKQTDKQTEYQEEDRAERDTCKIHKTNLTEKKLIGGWIHWPNMQLLFKFQVNRMKIYNFINSAYVELLAYVNLQNNRWLNSVTWNIYPLQISSQSDENWGF